MQRFAFLFALALATSSVAAAQYDHTYAGERGYEEARQDDGTSLCGEAPPDGMAGAEPQSRRAEPQPRRTARRSKRAGSASPPRVETRYVETAPRVRPRGADYACEFDPLTAFHDDPNAHGFYTPPECYDDAMSNRRDRGAAFREGGAPGYRDDR